jgi:hypothetical protein
LMNSGFGRMKSFMPGHVYDIMGQQIITIVIKYILLSIH